MQTNGVEIIMVRSISSIVGTVVTLVGAGIAIWTWWTQQQCVQGSDPLLLPNVGLLLRSWRQASEFCLQSGAS